MTSNTIRYVYDQEWASPAIFNIKNLCLVKKFTAPLDNVFFANGSITDAKSKFLNTSLFSINTPNVTSQAIEEFIGGTWVYTNGRQELRQVDLTFRDTADGLLWRSFMYVYDALQNMYPDDCKWHLELRILSQNFAYNGNQKGYHGSTLIQTDSAIMTNISQMNFSKDQGDSFLTFTVTFKYYIETKTTENLKALDSHISNINKGA